MILREKNYYKTHIKQSLCSVISAVGFAVVFGCQAIQTLPSGDGGRQYTPAPSYWK